MQYDKEQLANLISEVEKEFKNYLGKSENFAPKEKKDEHKEESAESHEAPEHKAPAEHKEHAEAAAPEHKEAEGEKREESSESHKEHEMDPEEQEYMDRMYKSLSPHELRCHHDSIRRAHEHHGLAKCGDLEMSESLHAGSKEGSDSKIPSKEAAVQKSEIQASAPGKTPGAKSADSAANGEKINKSDDHNNGGEISANAPGKIPGAKSADSDAHGEKINKSESFSESALLKSELEATKAKNEELKKNFDAVTEILTVLAKKSAPQGKAITSLDVVAKSEPIKEEVTLSRQEITSILTKKASDSKLEKKERELINAYYNGASLNSIAHLLK